MTEEEVRAVVDDAVTENNRLWQSRFDKLLAEKKEADEQLKSKASVDHEAVREREILDRRERIFNNALDRGLDPRMALEVLLGEDDDARLDKMQAGLQDQVDKGVSAEVEKRFKNAPKPAAGLPAYMPNWSEISQMPEEQLQAMGPHAIAEAARTAERGSTSLRRKVANALGMTGRLGEADNAL